MRVWSKMLVLVLVAVAVFHASRPKVMDVLWFSSTAVTAMAPDPEDV